MLCPYCNGKTIVTEVRADNDKVIRRRLCVTCRQAIMTEESPLDYVVGLDLMKNARQKYLAQLSKKR